MQDDESERAAAIARALSLSDEQLLEEIAGSLGTGATQTDRKRRGRQVYANLSAELRTRICADERVIVAFVRSKDDDVQAISAIIDCIVGVLHGIPPATIAVLLYRSGLSKYCGSDWPPAALPGRDPPASP